MEQPTEQLRQTPERRHTLEDLKQNENLTPAFDELNSRYDKIDNKEKREAYKFHADEVITLAIETGEKLGLNQEETALLEVATIFHDFTKADKPREGVPPHMKGLDAMVAHGQTAADLIRDAYKEEQQDPPEYVTKAIKYVVEQSKNYHDSLPASEKVKHTVISEKDAAETIAVAIEQHMGPRPGFMENVLNTYNSQVGEDLRLVHPDPDTKVAVALQTADMRSLVGEAGKKKVMADIAIVPNFKDSAIRDARVYSQLSGRAVTEGQAAFMSCYRTGITAVDMCNRREPGSGLPNTGSYVDSSHTNALKRTYEYNNYPYDGKTIDTSVQLKIEDGGIEIVEPQDFVYELEKVQQAVDLMDRIVNPNIDLDENDDEKLKSAQIRDYIEKAIGVGLDIYTDAQKGQIKKVLGEESSQQTTEMLSVESFDDLDKRKAQEINIIDLFPPENEAGNTA